MTRKRFVKLLMSIGYDRNTANKLAKKKIKKDYRNELIDLALMRIKKYYRSMAPLTFAVHYAFYDSTDGGDLR